jgi:hypothetical protein
MELSAGSISIKPLINGFTLHKDRSYSGVAMRKHGSGLPDFCKAHRELDGLYKNHNIGVVGNR